MLIADVSGKGTSAALYMAELKGLVLSFSQIYQSPRQLLMEVNRIISENLDARSFITMTYAVLDLALGTMTFARAGHTPLIYLSGEAGARRGGAHAERDRRGPPNPWRDREICRVARGTPDRSAPRGRPRLVHRRHHRGDEPGERFVRRRPAGRLVAEHGHLESGELRERILREIEAFVGSADQHDDMTMILIKVERMFASEEKVAVLKRSWPLHT